MGCEDMKKGKHREYGFTYIEIIICIGIVACFIGPLSQAFLSAIRTRVAANRIEEVTGYTEQLMLEVKEAIRTEELLYSSDKVIKEDFQALSVRNKETGYISNNLEALLGRNDLKRRYQMEQYAYEVAIWREQDLIESEEMVELDERVLSQSIRFYSDEEAKSLFQEKKDEKSFVAIELKHSNSKRLEENKDIHRVTICFTENGQVSKINDAEEPIPIKVRLVPYIETKGKQAICHLEIEEERNISKREGFSIIELDCSTVSSNQPLKVKLTNDTHYNQLIQICHKIESDDKGTRKQEQPKLWDIMVEDKNEGKSTLIHTQYKISDVHYVIMIRIKDKNPVQGEKGKVLKQMVDRYN